MIYIAEGNAWVPSTTFLGAIAEYQFAIRLCFKSRRDIDTNLNKYQQLRQGKSLTSCTVFSTKRFDNNRQYYFVPLQMAILSTDG